MKIKEKIIKIIWISAETVRSRLRPLIEGTVLFRCLQVPSKFIRRHFDWRKHAKDSIFFREEEMEMCSLLPKRVLDIIIQRFGPKTVLDVGCGTGQSIQYLVGQGIDAIGIEGSQLAISKASYPERITQVDLNRPVFLKRRFDAIFCYEVVDHIHPDFLDTLMATFSRHSDLIIMSHAQPGQGGEGHFNEQTDDYWIHQFAIINFEMDQPATVELKGCGDAYAANLLVFRKAHE